MRLFTWCTALELTLLRCCCASGRERGGSKQVSVTLQYTHPRSSVIPLKFVYQVLIYLIYTFYYEFSNILSNPLRIFQTLATKSLTLVDATPVSFSNLNPRASSACLPQPQKYTDSTPPAHPSPIIPQFQLSYQQLKRPIFRHVQK
jgi:hypothetical protein